MDKTAGDNHPVNVDNNGAGHNGIAVPGAAAPISTQQLPGSAGDRKGLRRALRPPIPIKRRPVDPINDPEPYKGRPRHLVFSTIVLTVVLTAIMAFPLVPSQVEIQPGMPANKDILSPSYVSYPSKVLTDKAREQTMNDPANEVWVQDKSVVQGQRSKLLNLLSVLEEVRQNETLDVNARRQRLASLPDVKLTPTQMDTMLTMSDGDYRYWRDSAVLPAFDAIMNNRRLTSADDVATARASLPDTLVPSLTSDQRAAAIAFLSPLLTINMHLDEEQTAARREAAANVKPVLVTVQKGEAILRQGELATPEAIEKMQEAGLLSRNVSAENVVGTAGLVLLMMILLHLYIYRYAPQVWRRQKQLLLVGMLVALTIGVAVLTLPGHSLLPYFLPVASVAMLIAVLLNPNLAVLVAFVLSVLLGMGQGQGNTLSMDLPLYYFVGSLTGIFTLTRVERVSAFARAGFYITVASFLTAFMLKVITGATLDWSTVGNLSLAAIFNGGMSTAITYAAFSLLGTLFGITTPLQLMELAHPDQPLLRRLMHEAPGTYHHSLVVSNLAEHAAEMIGADSLLTRVSAYYHDIGKVVHPYYFIDNQAGMSNVHDELSPWESAKIISRHVDDGITLARQNNLPRRVIDAIPQHHGTMLVKYFYFKALEQDPGANPADFRYRGPRPQTKENAILMLADGVEATVRSMAQSGALAQLMVANSDASESPGLYNDTASLPEDAIATVVHKVITERIEDGQLDECDLTVHDISRIQEAFVGMLKGIYHPRVPYPEKPRVPAAPPQAAEPAVPAPANVHAISEARNKRGRRRLRPGSVESKHEPQTPAAGV